MRKTLMLATALATMAFAAPVYAAGAGAAAGAATGGTLGFFLGGPIGAIVGGFSGALMGSGVQDTTISYAGTHPVEEVYLKDNLNVGYHVSGDVKIYPIEGDTSHGYFYANNRVWIVDMTSGKVVASPGYVVSEKAIAYVKTHHQTSVKIKGTLAPGSVLDKDVTYTDIPDAQGYSYVYVNDHPALVDSASRTVIWVN